MRVRKMEFGLKGARNYFWYRARVNLSTALSIVEKGPLHGGLETVWLFFGDVGSLLLAIPGN